MGNEFFILMKSELLLAVLLFVIIFTKLGNKEWATTTLLNLVNVLLFLNLAAGFFFNQPGTLFGDMFITNGLVVLEKNILNLGVLLISLQSYHQKDS